MSISIMCTRCRTKDQVTCVSETVMFFNQHECVKQKVRVIKKHPTTSYTRKTLEKDARRLKRQFRTRMLDLGLNYTQLGDRLGVSRQLAQKWIEDKYLLSAETIWRLAEVLECDIRLEKRR